MVTSSSGKFKYYLHFLYRCSYCNALIITKNRMDIRVEFQGNSSDKEKLSAAEKCMKKAIDTIQNQNQNPETITELLEKNKLGFGIFDGSYTIFGLDCGCPSCGKKNLWQKKAPKELIEQLDSIELPTLITSDFANMVYQQESSRNFVARSFYEDLASKIDSRLGKYKLLLRKNNLEKAMLTSQKSALESEIETAKFFSVFKLRREIDELTEKVNDKEGLINSIEQEVTIYEQMKSKLPVNISDDCYIDIKLPGKTVKDKYEDPCGGIMAVAYCQNIQENCSTTIINNILSA